jgi:hypothetical protein
MARRGITTGVCSRAKLPQSHQDQERKKEEAKIPQPPSGMISNTSFRPHLPKVPPPPPNTTPNLGTEPLILLGHFGEIYPDPISGFLRQ